VEWPPRSPDIDGFLFGVFFEGQCLLPPAADNTTRAQDTIREASADIDQEILHNVWQESEYRFVVAQPLVALTLNFINDKLLFIKLFQLAF
jgi:hypothetical protein